MPDRRFRLIASFCLLLGLALISAAPACAQGDPVKARGVLRIGLEGTYPPFNYQDAGGQLAGFEVDVAKAVAARMGVRAQFQPAPFAGLLAALDIGRVDVVINQITMTDERRRKYDFTDPYTVSGIQIIVRKDNPAHLRGPGDLAGKRIGVGLGTNYEQWVRANQPRAQVKTYDDDPTKYQDLRSGRIDAVLNDRLAAIDMMRRTGGAFAGVGQPFSRQLIGIAIKKNDPALLADLNRALGALRASGQLASISTQWFGSDVTR